MTRRADETRVIISDVPSGRGNSTGTWSECVTRGSPTKRGGGPKGLSRKIGDGEQDPSQLGSSDGDAHDRRASKAPLVRKGTGLPGTGHLAPNRGESRPMPDQQPLNRRAPTVKKREENIGFIFVFVRAAHFGIEKKL